MYYSMFTKVHGFGRTTLFGRAMTSSLLLPSPTLLRGSALAIGWQQVFTHVTLHLNCARMSYVGHRRHVARNGVPHALHGLGLQFFLLSRTLVEICRSRGLNHWITVTNAGTPVNTKFLYDRVVSSHLMLRAKFETELVQYQ